MKAWIVENIRISDDFGWNEIVFADNYKEAKKLALETDLYEYNSDFVNMRVKRYAYLDGMEHLSEKELDFEKWKHGWCWEGIQNPYYEEQLSEEENRKIFEEWYSEYWECEENAND